MKKEKKIPRFTLKHGAYYWTPIVGGVTKWMRLSKGKEEVLLMCKSKKGGPMGPKVKNVLQLFKKSKQWQSWLERLNGPARSTCTRSNIRTITA